VRAADTVPKATRGWDAAKKVNGRKRHIAVDTTGLVLDVVITPASVQDRQGARPLLWNTHRDLPDRLDWAALDAVEPTWVVGFSDISTLITPMTLRSGIATIPRQQPSGYALPHA
jgi:hypothetical protein